MVSNHLGEFSQPDVETVTKLDLPIPYVNLQGPDDFTLTRQMQFAVISDVYESACSSTPSPLAYEWTLPDGSQPAVWGQAEASGTIATSRSSLGALYVPVSGLPLGENELKLTVTDQDGNSNYDTLIVTVASMPLYAEISGGSAREWSVSEDLVLSGEGSINPNADELSF